MGNRLPPLSVTELFVHALEIECECAGSCDSCAACLRDLGAGGLAEVLEAQESDVLEQLRTLRLACKDEELPKLPSWESASRLVGLPAKHQPAPRVAPRSVREAMQVAVMARQRARDFYRGISERQAPPATHARAADLAAGRQRQVQRLEKLLEGQIRAAAAVAGLRASAGHRP